jgi:GNAT superfamily N-acetyltransferase
MIIREIQPSDLPDFLQLLHGKAKFDGAEAVNRATIDTLMPAFFGVQPSIRALVVEHDGELVAMATYYTVFSLYLVKPSIWLNDLFVQPSWRNNRIGEKLLARLANIAIDLGCERIDWIVAVTNDGGQSFYKRLGAEVFDSVKLARFNQAAIAQISEMWPNNSFKPNLLRSSKRRLDKA